MTEDRTEQTESVIASTKGESSHPLSAAVSRRRFLRALAFGALGATGIAILPKVIQDALSSMSPTAIANPEKTATPGAAATVTEAPPATTTTTPEKTATPAPTSKYQVTEQGITFKTEKNEILTVPQVEGAKAYLEKYNGEDIVLYRATADNPFGLKEQEVVGTYYPEAYSVTDKVETAKQVGAVGLRAEAVRYFLQKVGSPSKVVIVPLPFDATTSTEDKKIYIEVATMKQDRVPRLFVQIPPGSKLTPPIIEQGASKVDITFAPQQSWGTVIDFDRQGILKKYAYLIEFDQLLTGRTLKAVLGEDVLTVKASLSPDRFNRPYDSYLQHPVSIKANATIYGQSYVEDNSGQSMWLFFTENNIMRFDKSYVFPLVNDNPLLTVKP